MNLFRIILIIFLLGFIYHLSAIVIECCCDVFHFTPHNWIHIGSVILSALIAFGCYKAITKKKPPEEKE